MDAWRRHIGENAESQKKKKKCQRASPHLAGECAVRVFKEHMCRPCAVQQHLLSAGSQTSRVVVETQRVLEVVHVGAAVGRVPPPLLKMNDSINFNEEMYIFNF
jgi:hypothetical protein